DQKSFKLTKIAATARKTIEVPRRCWSPMLARLFYHRTNGGRGPMQYGLFTMPSHPPEGGLLDGPRWDLQTLPWAAELGFRDGWIGEHHPAPWEPPPSPDLLIAQSLMETSQIRLAPGGFLLPYHHPAELANRVAMLDHMAQGRLNFGVAASGLPSDW